MSNTRPKKVRINCLTWAHYTKTYPNPLTLKSDQHLISPYNITSEAYIKVKRMNEMITNYRNSWFLNKFSLTAPKEMYGERYGKYAYWS